MINWGDLPAGTVIPFPFTTYGKTNGESITLTGLAVTDIEVYKGVSMTQRASDAGYTLLDTDGIDIDGVTGFHGFSIDTGDNTDAGFYAAGSLYTVLVSAVTIDSQTVSFIAGTFRLVVAEDTAGYRKVTVKSGTGTGELSLSSGAVLLQATQTGVTIPTVTTLTNAPSDSAGVTTLLTRLSALRAGYLDNLSAGAVALASSILDAAGIRTAVGLASANLDTQIAALSTKVDTLDDFVDTEIAAILAAVDTEMAAVKAKTDSLTFTVAGVVDANLQRVNDVALVGDGAATPWGP